MSPRVRLAFGLTLAAVAVAILFGPQMVTLGRQTMATRLSQRAQEKLVLDNDPAGALEDIQQAIGWLPDEPKLIFDRAYCRLQAGELAGSLEDFNSVIDAKPSYSTAYTCRAMVYQRLGRHREAIEDTTRVIALRPDNDHGSLNHRAYTRALAGQELDEGLSDIEQALKLAGSDVPAYLDTRGYLLHLLGRNKQALADMNAAIKITEADRVRQEKWRNASDPRAISAVLRSFDSDLAVMYHHRGLIHEKLGNTDQAQADLNRGDQLGFDPERGIY